MLLGCVWVMFWLSLGLLWVVFGSSLGRLWVVFGLSLGRLWVVFGSSLGRLWVVFWPFFGLSLAFRPDLESILKCRKFDVHVTNIWKCFSLVFIRLKLQFMVQSLKITPS